MALSGWSKRIKITIAASRIDAALAGFPIRIKLSTSSGINSADVSAVFDELGSDANRKKIAIATDADVECYVEIQHWSDANEYAELWVKIPNISASTDTDIYIYYDSSHADNTSYVGDTGSTPAQNVWDSNFTHVLHLEEQGDGTADEYKESTSNGNHGQGGASMYPDAVTDLINKAQQFGSAADSEYIRMDGADPDGGSEITVECISKLPASFSGANTFVMNPGGVVNACFLLYNYLSKARFFVYTSGGYDFVDGATTLSASTAYFFAGRWKSGEKIQVWLNTSQDGEASSARTGVINRGYANQFEIGNWHVAGGYEAIDHIIDEVRISDLRRSDAWLKATYYSNFDDLVSFGSEETMGGVISAEANDGIALGDSSQRTAILQGIALDGLNMGETAERIADLLAAAADGVTIGETLVSILKALASAADGISLGDESIGSIAGAVIEAAAADGIVFSESSQAIANLVAQAIDGQVFGDAAAGQATIQVTASDGLKFAEALGAVMTFSALATDGFKLGDVSYHFLPSGEVSISLTVKKLTLTFNVKQPGISVSAKKPDTAMGAKQPTITLTTKKPDIDLQ